jgi:hypothetical protein
LRSGVKSTFFIEAERAKEILCEDLRKEAMKQKRQVVNLPSVRSSVFGFIGLLFFVSLQVAALILVVWSLVLVPVLGPGDSRHLGCESAE